MTHCESLRRLRTHAHHLELIGIRRVAQSVLSDKLCTVWIRGRVTKHLLWLTAITLAAAPFPALAMPSTSRTVCGEVRSVDYSNRVIVFFWDGEERTVGIRDRTKFYRDGELVTFSSIEAIGRAELVYKRPLFGEYFAIKIRWTSQKRLLSAACNDGS